MTDKSDKTLVRTNFPINIKFLVLEDMDNIRQQLVSDLRTLGVLGEINEAANVQTAVNICSQREIGFVICDWNLPDGTGHDFLKKFRAVERFKKIPFIMCTSNNEIHYFLEAVASGADDYIVKPWKIEQLKSKIELTWSSYLKKK